MLTTGLHDFGNDGSEGFRFGMAALLVLEAAGDLFVTTFAPDPCFEPDPCLVTTFVLVAVAAVFVAGLDAGVLVEAVVATLAGAAAGLAGVLRW